MQASIILLLCSSFILANMAFNHTQNNNTSQPPDLENVGNTNASTSHVISKRGDPQYCCEVCKDDSVRVRRPASGQSPYSEVLTVTDVQGHYT